ncbi:DNA (cytosine-5-)-methyltransferase [Cognatishimia sp.]|uniref:DNA (cytosine-5-)-methyltransferase n=1 Tax=Cognatishimia sp. TaxID=2211648 RepID=UPI003516DB2D|nr:DNA (cytosine-5-)-methyltransferase [Cognatishimia sp.]
MVRVLSLFDGCAGARQALDSLGIRCLSTYFASEIDKYAKEAAVKNYPDIHYLPDVTKLDESNLPNHIDLMIGGSPCQSFSIAKRQKESGLEKGKSTLFWEYVRILNIVKPKVFILENVASMKNIDKDKISEVLGVNPVMINSSLLTAQSRKRYYWVGKLRQDLTYETIPIEQPLDEGIILHDILEDPNDYSDRLKSYCVTATYQRACPKDYFNHGQRQLIFMGGVGSKDWAKDGKNLSRNYPQGSRVYSSLGKAVTLSANAGGIGGKTGMYEINQEKYNQLLMYYGRSEEGKLARKKHKEENGKDGGSRDSNSREWTIKQDQSKSPCVTSSTDARILQTQECVVRKLTPIECERLQGMKDNYTEGVSNTQRYKMIGNGFTIPVISYLLTQINKEFEWV